MSEVPALLTSNNLETFTEEDWDCIISDVIQLLTAFGDGPAPLEDTARTIGTQLVAYLRQLLLRAYKLRQSSNDVDDTGLPVTAEDVLAALTDEPVKHKRIEKLLKNWSELNEMLEGFIL